ncbi:unnamed protein product [Mytilus coruscus]|uniref:Uncharacterized protein n=1 Tax=Mytilus coruscus TaxID=42192 RepID=A0A6J8E4D8_MYTCO|nr:unnamed protein product [Mytilus coruscus]
MSCCVIVKTQIPQHCRKITPCSCIDEWNRIVNLTVLANKLTPRFKDYPTAGGDNNKYSWNPCNNFEEGPENGGCINVGACKISPNGTYTGLGQSNSVEFSHDDNGNLSLVMTQQDGDKKIETHVILYCDEKRDAAFRVIGQVTDRIYWLQLWSKYNCPSLMNSDDIVTMPAPGSITERMPTMPSPGVVTMTSSPSQDKRPLKDTEIILFCILVMVTLILAVLLTRYTIKLRTSKEETIGYTRLPQYDAQLIIQESK